MVQRVLGAKDEWHARMGVVGAGYLRIITPLFFVLPGIIAFKLFPNLPRQDMASLELVTGPLAERAAAGHGLSRARQGAHSDGSARSDFGRHGGGPDEQCFLGA